MEALRESDQRNREFLVQLEEQREKQLLKKSNEIENFLCCWQLFWLKSNAYYIAIFFINITYETCTSKIVIIMFMLVT